MISFIIPCFNGKAALDNTLKSLAWQTNTIPFEVILIDNNSDRENLNELYEKYVDRLNIYLVKQPKLISTYALCRARNIGLRLAKYKWICTLDSDIILPPTYLKIAGEKLENKSNVMLCGKRIFILRQDIEPLNDINLSNASPIPSSSNYNQILDRRLPYLEDLDRSTHPWAFFHGCNTIFEKAKAQSVGGYDEKYDGQWGYEDIDFAYRMMKDNDVQPIYEEDLYVYHQEEEIMGTLNRNDKSTNPNWALICQRIQGFKAFKTKQYELLNPSILLS